MNAAEVAARKDLVAAQNAQAPQTLEVPTKDAVTLPTTTVQPGSATAAQPNVPPAADTFVVDGVTYTPQQIRDMQTLTKTYVEKESALTHRERLLSETKAALETTVREMMQKAAAPPQTPTLPTPEPSTTPTESATPLVDALGPLSARVAQMEREAQIQGLRQRYGQIDEQAVRTTLATYPGIAPEAALTMVVGAAALAERSRTAGAEAAHRLGDSARVETPANTGVVPTTRIDPSKVSWDGMDQVAREALGSQGLLVNRR